MVRFALFFAAALALFACSGGPGRPPVYPDATVFEDAHPADVHIADSGFPDSGVSDISIGLPDTGPPPHYPFTGIFEINNDTAVIDAREVDGKLSLIVGHHPYVYVGTITQQGYVDVTSKILEDSGCALAQITGTYSRASAFFTLRHRTCSPQGSPVDAMITGALISRPQNDINPSLSGIFELEAVLMADVGHCFQGGNGPFSIAYGINVVGNRIHLFTASPVFGEPIVYIGSATQVSFGALHQPFVTTGSPFDVAVEGAFSQASVNEPLILTGRQDLRDRTTGCGISVTFEGARRSIY